MNQDEENQIYEQKLQAAYHQTIIAEPLQNQYHASVYWIGFYHYRIQTPNGSSIYIMVYILYHYNQYRKSLLPYVNIYHFY